MERTDTRLCLSGWRKTASDTYFPAYLISAKLHKENALELYLHSYLSPDSASVHALTIDALCLFAKRNLHLLQTDLYTESSLQKNLALLKDEYGKPLVRIGDDISDVKISISHSKALRGMLIANSDVGLDIELINNADKDFRWLEIAKRFFSVEEVRKLMKCEYEEGRFEFLRLWTRKEALFKLRGGSFFSVLALNLAGEHAGDIFCVKIKDKEYFIREKVIDDYLISMCGSCDREMERSADIFMWNDKIWELKDFV